MGRCAVILEWGVNGCFSIGPHPADVRVLVCVCMCVCVCVQVPPLPSSSCWKLQPRLDCPTRCRMQWRVLSGTRR
jgi:hypothetical protein